MFKITSSDWNKMANLKYETDVLDILHSEALVNITQECAHYPRQKINKLSENF